MRPLARWMPSREPIARAGAARFGVVLAALLPLVLPMGLTACGGGGEDGAPAEAPEQRHARIVPTGLAPPAPPPAPPGTLSGGAMWAQGIGRGGGGGGGRVGGRPLAREAFERNRRERIARDGALSQQPDVLLREGQRYSAGLAERLPPNLRQTLTSPSSPNQDPEEAVRERCQALLEMNRQTLRVEGGRGSVAPGAFLGRCQQFPMELFSCADRGEEGRRDPECRPYFARLDREVRELRAQGEAATHPEQRLDELIDDPRQGERPSVAPSTITPEVDPH